MEDFAFFCLKTKKGKKPFWFKLVCKRITVIKINANTKNWDDVLLIIGLKNWVSNNSIGNVDAYDKYDVYELISNCSKGLKKIEDNVKFKHIIIVVQF